MTNSSFENPLEDPTNSRALDPCIVVIFGASGDLTARKLMPALYNLVKEGQLPSHFACVGVARRAKTNEQFRQEMSEAVSKHSRTQPIDQRLWQAFAEQIFYHVLEFDKDEDYEKLKGFLADLDARFGTRGNRIFYLSVPPSYFAPITDRLGKHGMVSQATHEREGWTKLIVEKPFGHDLESAKILQKEISKYFKEEQIYRIDHYLGKETVQNLLVMRFANSIFESVWNNKYIDHVQITFSEDIGVGTRGKLWEESGMLRDIVQNHLMQVLTLTAMEPPVNLHADSVRDEKVKVLESIRPILGDEIPKNVVRGQYGPGFIDGNPVKGYTQEDNVDPRSPVETFMAMRLFIDNWRWSGVPFYLRAGKRLPKRATEIAIYLKGAPDLFFCHTIKKYHSDVLVIRIQPNEGISLRMNSKVPGMSPCIQPVRMDFRYGSYFGASPPEAYERLICDCILGDSTLFAREDEALASWKLLTPILNYWQETAPHNFPNYPAGSWGPNEADELINRYGKRWRLI